MNSWSCPLGGSAKTATRVAMPLCTRSAASSAQRAHGPSRYDNKLRGRDRLVDDERPSCGSQSRLPNGGNSNDGRRGQCGCYQDLEPPPPEGARAGARLQVCLPTNKGTAPSRAKKGEKNTDGLLLHRREARQMQRSTDVPFRPPECNAASVRH
jgi:hypothetical protein